jgi:hypothetical protein
VPDKGSYAEKSKTTRTAAGWPLASARGEAQDEPNNPACRLSVLFVASGEVSEWLKEHAWKVCIR